MTDTQHDQAQPQSPDADPRPSYAIAREAFTARLQAEGLAVRAVFVPHSRSRHAAGKWQSLNWKCTLTKGDREIVTVDYSAGEGHAPAYANTKDAFDRRRAIAAECEHGRIVRVGHGRHIHVTKTPILPDPVDVWAAICSDADVLDVASFEEWASNLGMDADSRKAEATYRECVRIAVAVRAWIGGDVLQALQEIGREL